MNKIFKVIWNHTTQSWVAVSELTSAKSKTKSKTAAKLTALSLVAGSALVAGNAMAAVYVNGSQIIDKIDLTKTSTTITVLDESYKDKDYKDNEGNLKTKTITLIQSVEPNVTNNSKYPESIFINNDNLINTTKKQIANKAIVIGSNAPLSTQFGGKESVKIGFDIADQSTGSASDTVIGNRIVLGGGGSDSMSTAVGYNAQVAGPSVALGIGARADILNSQGWTKPVAGGLAVGGFALAGGNVDSSISVGSLSSATSGGAVSVGVLSGATSGGTASKYLDPDERDKTGFTWSEGGGSNAASFGYNAAARGSNTVAVGANAATGFTGSNNSVTVGANSSALRSGVALGNKAIAGRYNDASITIIKNAITTTQTALDEARAFQKRVEEQFHKELRDLQNTENQAATQEGRAPTTISINEVSASTKYRLATANAIVERAQNAIQRLQRDLRFQSGTAKDASGNDVTVSVVDSTYTVALGDSADAANNMASAVGYQSLAAGSRSFAGSVAAKAYGNSAVSLGDSAVSGVSTALSNAYSSAHNTYISAYDNYLNALSSRNDMYSNFVTAGLQRLSVADIDALNKAGVEDLYDYKKVAALVNAGTLTFKDDSQNPLDVYLKNAKNLLATEGENGDLTAKTKAKDTAFNNERQAYYNLMQEAKDYSTAIGASSNAAATNSVALGYKATVSNNSTSSVALGDNAQAGYSASWTREGTRYYTYLDAPNGVVLGANSQIAASKAVAVGASNKVFGQGSGAFGSGNNVGEPNVSIAQNGNSYVTGSAPTGHNSFAIGNNNTITSDKTFVLGNNITIKDITESKNNVVTKTTDRTGAVVLGDASDGGNKTDGADSGLRVKAVNSATVGNYTYSGFAGNLGGTDTNGNPSNAANDKQGRFVSIGSSGSERQIKHVAAGEISATSTDAINGSQLYLVAHKLGNGPVVYTDAAGNKLTQAADGKWYPTGSVVSTNGNVYPAGTTLNADGTPTDNSVQPIAGIESGDVIASMNNPATSTTNTAGNPYTLSNVGAGANVYGAVDSNGNPLTAVDEKGNVLVPVIAADGTVTYYAANQVVNGVPVENATAVTPTSYYTADKFNPTTGKLIAGSTTATPVTTTTATPMQSSVLAAKRGLADLSSANPTNAITVADARNMGWVVSANNTLTDATNGTSNTTAYADSVKNANEVRFTGTGIATVSGKTDDNGVRTINVHVDAQAVSESAQNPVVYTTADGTKLTKVGDNFYPTGSVVSSNGNVYPAGTTLDSSGNPTDSSVTALTATPVANVIASMNNAGNSTTTPMALSNVGAGANTFPAVDAEGNKLTPVTGDDGTITYYPADQVGTDGKLKDADTATPKTALVLANDGKWYDASKVDSKGTPASGATSVDTPKNVGTSGLVDFANSNPTNAATVKDLQNMGWVISTSDNEYEDQVRNANKVDFKGGDGIEVTGKTTADGTREITIGLKKGEVISTNDASKTGTTTDADGKTVNVVKASDGNWYPADQVTTTTDANGNAVVTPNEGATAVTTTVTTNTDGSGFVTGNQVADAIEASGWNVGKATADTMKNATGTALTGDTVEKVNPNDNVRYVDGTNITQTLKTATETNADGTTHTTTYIQADLNPNVTLGGNDAGKNGSLTINNTGDKAAAEVKTDTAGNGVVNVNDKDGNTGVAITANNGAGTVTINGSDGSQAAIGVVKAPTNLADMLAGAVNVDGKWYNPSDVTTTTDAAGNTTTTVNAGATPISNTMDRIQYTDANGTPHQVATMEDGLKFRGDDGQSISKPLNSTVELTGGNRTTTNADGSTTSAPVARAATTTGNIGVFNDNGKMSVQLAKDLQGMNSATFGGDNNSAQTVINGNGVTVNPAGNTDPANTVSVTTNGVNAGNQRVTNVAPGRIAADSKDAVNGSQLYGVAQNVNNLGNKINRMDKDLRAGVAGANAAAGLPQVYLPGKSMVAASAGTFKGQNAVAIGYSRASDNGKVIFKLQGNANSQGDVGGSVGVGYQW